MKRWDTNQMLDVGKKLFAKIHKRKYHAHHNNEIHYMAREVDEWLPKGIQSIIGGTYNPRCLKRYYFSDEVVDQLHLSDRIFQHILLKQLKPTFKHVMNPNCYHYQKLSSSLDYVVGNNFRNLAIPRTFAMVYGCLLANARDALCGSALPTSFHKITHAGA